MYNKLDSVIVLSTDKAVEPINAMGISKAMMEKLAIKLANRAAIQKLMLHDTAMFSFLGGPYCHTLLNCVLLSRIYE